MMSQNVQVDYKSFTANAAKIFKVHLTILDRYALNALNKLSYLTFKQNCKECNKFQISFLVKSCSKSAINSF